MTPANKRWTDEQFIALWEEHRSPAKVARALNIDLRNCYRYRNQVEERHHVRLVTDSGLMETPDDRHDLKLINADIVLFSDAHWWPGIFTPANAIMLDIMAHMQPSHVIANGDIFDGATISRHPKIGWEKPPSVKEELATVTERMGEVEQVCKGAVKKRTKGNHCMRYDARLADRAGEFEGVYGMRLKDHLPKWDECMSIMINDSFMIKHRWHGGVHAAYNNVMKSGMSMATGHTHACKVIPFTDYNGTRFGIETGTLAHRNHPAFAYTEDAPKNWQPGFIIVQYRQGIMKAEAVNVENNQAIWAGKVWHA